MLSVILSTVLPFHDGGVRAGERAPFRGLPGWLDRRAASLPFFKRWLPVSSPCGLPPIFAPGNVRPWRRDYSGRRVGRCGVEPPHDGWRAVVALPVPALPRLSVAIRRGLYALVFARCRSLSFSSAGSLAGDDPRTYSALLLGS